MTPDEAPTAPASEQPDGSALIRRIARLVPVLALDALLIIASYAAALALRFDGAIPRESMVFFGQVIAVIVLAYVIGNYFFGIYRTAWNYAGVADAMSLASAVGLVSILLLGINVFLTPRHIPLTVTGIAPLLIFLSMGVAKLWPRLRTQAPFTGWGGSVQHVLIAGAGHTGQMLAREFLQHQEWHYRPIGFIDDDARKRGTRIHGLPVLGTRSDIPEVARTKGVDLVALAMPSASGATIREFVGLCQDANVAVRTVPGVPEMVHAGGEPGQLREVTVDDLLGSQETEIDAAACAALVHNKAVLITGAAGYLGQELARQLLAYGPAVLHLLDTNETGLYDLQRDLAAEGDEVRIWMTNIVDRAQVDRTFRSARPHVIFHTAAYKHIPVIEEHPEAAFHVNVAGTMNLCRAAADVDTERLIFVSSNKAADLDSVYGATKRIGELLAASMSQEHSTRFTAPPEAVKLLIQAGAQANDASTLVLDLGEEVRIADLAEKLIRLRGYQPGKDIEIVYTGLRPGEQVIEEPLEKRGRFLTTGHPKIYQVEGTPTCSADEIIGRIEELQRNMPESRDELATRLHALARIDLRDVQPAPATSDN